ncbi:MAG: hypothetical protein DI570_09190 [Phenylobacterium zucineum]|nr:MAG: hypothetical protein DI570_09190 [Phenylobacterium zucineum]
MAMFYGSIVGAVISALSSNPLVSVAHKDGADRIIIRDTVELAAAAANDTVSLVKVDWETVINPDTSKFWFDDLGTGNTVSIGDVTYPNALCNAQDTSTAAGSALIMKSVDVANYFKPLWQVLGYASLAAAKAVGTKCELLAKVNSAAATGTLTWQIFGAKKI